MIDAALVRNDVESAAFWYKKSADELTLPTEEPWHFEPKSGPWLFFGTMGIVWQLFCSSEPAELRCTFEFIYALIILSRFRFFLHLELLNCKCANLPIGSTSYCRIDKTVCGSGCTYAQSLPHLSPIASFSL